MARRGKTRRKRQNKIIGRLARSFMAVVILTAFVLLVSFSVKAIATMDAKKFASVTRPILSKLNINVDEEQVGEVAGKFVERLTKTGKAEEVSSDETNNTTTADEGDEESTVTVVHKIAFLADSEDNFGNLSSALGVIGGKDVDVVFFLGDLTSYGEKGMLMEGKSILDNSRLEYYILPGDHDLAASEPPGPDNFIDVFDVRHQAVHIGDFKFILFDNSANYTPLKEEDMMWFEREIDDADFVLLSQPLYHPSLDVVMGRVDGQTIGDVRGQAEELLRMIRSFGVKAVFAADQHIYSFHPDEAVPEIMHYVVGALVETSLERNPLGPHYAIMSIFDDGTYKVEDSKL